MWHLEYARNEPIKEKHITFGMVTKVGSKVSVDQSDPVLVMAEGPGTDTFLFCMLSIP